MVIGVNPQVRPTAFLHCIRMPLAFLHWLVMCSFQVSLLVAIQGDTQELGRRLHLYYDVVNFQRYGKLPFPHLHHMDLESARQRYNVLASLPRSSNLAEGWTLDNAFQCLMGCSNPTIWRFIDVLKEEQYLHLHFYTFIRGSRD